KGMVKHAGKKLAKKATPAGFALGALDLVKNPWTVAVNRANKTALALAAIIQRSNLESVVLVGIAWVAASCSTSLLHLRALPELKTRCGLK
ncbi:hypothetical protein, partial [Streptococcus pseudopneumoniae]|uniref:hypothetical protein n=1 Tax=Streptococcus pseudopneumoniae TaxID=257758 RepID=UPI0019D5FBDB